MLNVFSFESVTNSMVRIRCSYGWVDIVKLKKKMQCSLMDNLASSEKISRAPKELLRTYISSYIEDNNLHESLKEHIPGKWEKYGDFVLFDARSFNNEVWYKQEAVFWEGICKILKCKRLALKSKIRNDNYRTPNVKMLVGDDPWIIYKDNSVIYSWNVEKNMFCAGNACERHRIAKLDCRNEIVVDMYAGIGYFVLPFLIHAKADFVHACEWNPEAVVALKRNLKLNNVEDRCFVYEGDNCHVCPKGIADRVNLGLIPTSEKSWRVACEALKPTGGTLHIHGNVETLNENVKCEKCSGMAVMTELNSMISMRTDSELLISKSRDFNWKHKQWLIWGIHALHSLISILGDINGKIKWVCWIENVNYVKSYAPHVDHLVLDVTLRKLETSDDKNMKMEE